jgi:serine/alanine adding enzyme
MQEMYMEIKLLGPESDSLWNDYVESNQNASIYHLTGWKNVIERVFGHESYYFYAIDDDGLIKGVLPLARLDSLIFGNFMVSLPFFNYGGVLAENEAIESHLFLRAAALARELNCEHILYRQQKKLSIDYPCNLNKVNVSLELPDSVDALFKQFKAKLRSQIKRPLREGIEIHIGHEELLPDFYNVFSVNMRDLGTPVYAKQFFYEIFKAFPNNCHLVTAKINEKPVGAAFLLGYRNSIEVPWASTLRQYNSIGANMFLYSEMLKFSIEKGYKTFDFGRSSVDSGTLRFKKQWGALTTRQLYWYTWTDEGYEAANISPNNPKYQVAIKAWKQLPLIVANVIGPMIVKNIP